MGVDASDTSQLARGLARLGCISPADGASDDPRIRSFNDEVLASAGSSRNDVAPFHEPWMRSPLAPVFLERAVTLLREQFGRAALFVLEDPAIARLMPFWTEALKRFGAVVKPVIAFHNPLATAAYRPSAGSDPLAELLWVRHAIDAEASTRGLQRFFSSSERVASDWDQVAEDAQKVFDLTWPKRFTAADMQADALSFATTQSQSELKQRALTSAALPGWLRDTYEILDRWAESGESPEDYSRLDRLKADFDMAAVAFARALRANRRRGGGVRGSGAVFAAPDVEDLKSRLQEQRRRNTLMEAELHQLREERQDIEAQLKEATAEVKTSRDRRKEMARIIERRNAELYARYQELATLQRRALRWSPSWRVKRLWGWIKRSSRGKASNRTPPPDAA